jgi:diguanylate cyclase (GGDEF)-like protein/PAS domain S-box-containing protein
MDANDPGSLSPAAIVRFPGGKRARRGSLDRADQSSLLAMVLDNMAQAVLLFDADTRLIFCNQRYVRMYGLSPELVKPGCTLRKLLDYRIEVNSFSGDVEEYVAKLADQLSSGETSSNVVKSGDGRVFLIVNKPLAGGGWLATHEDITERQRAEERIAHMAGHDALTDLPNRVLLRVRLENDLRRMRRGESLAVLCLDLDHFKSVNDTLGHPVGDELLQAVAERLRGCTRAADTVARFGGDEFAIILTGMCKPEDAVVLSQRVRQSIVRPFEVDGHRILIDISIGISVAPADATEPDLLLKNADLALYGAKSDGRGTYRFFEPDMDTRMKARRELEMDLRTALTNHEFELHYQPLVNLQTNEITAFEALIRWNRAGHGVVAPVDFIPVAEETGLIVAIGDWVLRQACQEAVKWPDDVKVAVNLSPAQLKAQNLEGTVMSALAASGMAPGRLQLEITESLLMQNTFATLAMLHRLRKLGVQIVLDDFGTGYSSLSYLRSFPFDKIKIDRTFIQDLSKGAEPLAIVHAVAGLAKCLNMTSTAEGVETRQQAETLQAVGCTEMQGHLFSRARPADEIARLFLARAPTSRTPA